MARPLTTGAVRTLARSSYRAAFDRGVGYLVTSLLAVVFFFPFFWMVSLSLKTPSQLAEMPPSWLPHPLAWENYVTALLNPNRPFFMFLKNSAVYTLVATLGNVLASAWVAYGFARLRFIGRDVFFVLLLSTMMLPSQVTLIPQYVLFKDLGWLDSLKPLVVPAYFGSAFWIFLMRQFFLTIPLEMDEAALIDGASRIAILWRILVPLSMPIVVTVIAFSFIAHWNDFLGPLIYLNSMEKMVASVALGYFRDEMYTAVGPLMAASVVTVLPIVAVFLAAQKSFVQGVTLTGLREG